MSEPSLLNAITELLGSENISVETKNMLKESQLPFHEMHEIFTDIINGYPFVSHFSKITRTFYSSGPTNHSPLSYELAWDLEEVCA